ncbi:hypothetical protein Cch01nite_09130 [Cellulomonas chitinilytica]|uniref:Peptidoglycan recognition protein family domain-containing protein n=1 Tax=Cellulomonas chitinilytica TaxID=398759 RepID=A0A919P320_9CELL|nr:peptidoglycan recognition protein [Cellulomonas chitinilytica]GIG20189.1 hypothetical protein Cch01nite_09130 [Cellulomonas chitinilytica]
MRALTMVVAAVTACGVVALPTTAVAGGGGAVVSAEAPSRASATAERPELDELPLAGVDTPSIDAAVDEVEALRADAGETSQAAPDASPDTVRGLARSAPADAADPGTDGAAPSVTATPDVLTPELDTREFTVLGFTWDPGPQDVMVAFRVRESGSWSEWQAVEAGDVAPDSGSRDAARSSRSGTDPIVASDADGLQVWAESATQDLTGLRAVLVDPTVRESDTTAAVAAAATSVPGQPPIISRAAWGADESLRACDPDYSPAMRAVAVHHTASANGYSADEVPAILRGFYAYHVQSRGWCDIGYNFLVDRFGRIFEGRAGGVMSTVVGVHTGGFNSRTIGIAAIGDYGTTSVPAALEDALVSLIAWKAAIHHIAADQDVTMVSGGGASKFPEGTVVSFPAVYGHRDAQLTSCPGQNLYDLLPTLRARVAAVANAAVVDSPVGAWEGLESTPSTVTVSGWALDRQTTAPLLVDVVVDGRVTVATADRTRTDVGAAYPAAGPAHGFAVTLPVPAGRHVVCVDMVRPGSTGVVSLGCRAASVVNHAPIGVVEQLQVSGVTLTVSGWTLDPDSEESTSVHVYVDSVGVAVTADVGRADVAAAYGHGELHGFAYSTVVPEGRHTVCVYAIDAGGGSPTTLRCSEIQVGSPPIGVLERVSVTGATLSVTGWAFDPDLAGPTSVHVYVDGSGVALAADRGRSDVGAAYGRDPRVGFVLTRSLTPGRHSVCVYAINAGGAPHPSIGCRDVEVRDNAPIGVVESIGATGSTITVTGWAFDPDESGSTSVHVYFGATGVAVPATRGRADVGAAYGRDAQVGFVASQSLPAGVYPVCVYVINTWGAPHRLLGCWDVEIRDAAPVGVVEAASAAGSTLSVSGWAFDPDAAGPTTVHVYVDGQGVAVAADIARADVGAAFRRDSRTGFATTRTVAPGTHTVCVYAINTWGAPHPSLGCRTVVSR